MENLFNEFMHIYFWVYIVSIVLLVMHNWDKEDSKYKANIGFWSMFGFVLFIMSFKF